MENLTLNQLTRLLSVNDKDSFNSVNIKLQKAKAGVLLLFSDIAMIGLALIISMLIRDLFWTTQFDLLKYFPLIPIMFLLFPIVFFLRGLYPGFGMDAIEELRSLTYTTTGVFTVLATFTFLIKDTWDYSRLTFILSFVFALIFIPLARTFVRNIFGKKDWWGIPVIIIGAGKAGEKVIKSLQKHFQLGLRPIVGIDDDSDRWGYINNIPVVGGLDIIPELAKKLNVDQAIIAMPNVMRKRQQEIVQKYSKYFNNTTLIPDIYGLSSLWVNTKDVGGVLGLEVQQRLLKRSSRIQKRIFDIIIASLLTITFIPLLLVISFLIKLDTRGRIFFRQERMGKNDSRFRIVKFRTMFQDAEIRLQELLKNNHEYRSEYEIYHKLRNDPRLTFIGRFLRKFSLDELPQFLNVIKGDMSLIGPRAYMPWEKVKMNGNEDMILKVKPGISGLWQVTDRNESSFEERNETDVYYIRNWSMFLDIYIVARTIGVVILGKGAY